MGPASGSSARIDVPFRKAGRRGASRGQHSGRRFQLRILFPTDVRDGARTDPLQLNMPPFVSIVVPVYNRADLLQQLLDSLLELQYPRNRFEVIIVDNGSTDGAWELAQKAAAQVPYYLLAIQNPGAIRLPSVSRNVGFAKSRGDIVAFTD